MTYTVTVNPLWLDDSQPCPEPLSRREVPTLSDARVAAAEAVFEHIGFEENLGYTRRPLITPTFIVEAHELPESGGTVGPLPNDIVIEVEPKS